MLGRAEQGSDMRGVLLVPPSSPTLPTIYGDLDVNILHLISRGFTSTMTRFHVESVNYSSTDGTPLYL